jgi:hypothetical protein
VALKLFNYLAENLRFRKLNREEIRDDLSSTIDQQLSEFVLCVRGTMLAQLGERKGAEEILKRMAADYPQSSLWRTPLTEMLTSRSSNLARHRLLG